MATDAVLVVDPESFLILDVNPSAERLLSSAGEQLVGKHVAIGFGHPSRGAVNELLTTARSSGQGGEIRARLLGSGDVSGLRRVLTGLDRDSIEMREVSPMGGLLSQEERQQVLADH